MVEGSLYSLWRARGSRWFDSMVRWKLGNGGRARFWLGEQKLAFMYPRLYMLTTQQREIIRDMGTWSGQIWN